MALKPEVDELYKKLHAMLPDGAHEIIREIVEKTVPGEAGIPQDDLQFACVVLTRQLVISDAPNGNIYTIHPLGRSVEIIVRYVDGRSLESWVRENDDLRALLEDVRDGYPDVEDFKSWKEVMGE
jgi:hypothetical protein